jgi:8-oxo-dGTP diphosphatase
VAIKRFPCGQYGRQKLQFFAAPYRPPIRAFAALVFPWQDGKVLVCDIADRGWSIPSGRVEPFESAIDAARREAVEEAGAMLADLQYIGCYHISERQEVRWAECFVARVDGLVDIVMQQESLGRRLCTLEELAGIYHLWNDLTEQVFIHSREILERRNRCG